MVKCVNCLYYKNSRCTDRHGVKFNDFGSPLGDIDCPAYIGAGYVCFERRKEEEKMGNGHNGGILRRYKVPCLKDGACDEVASCDELVEVEEIGYRNDVMYIRCLKCGYEQHAEGIIPI